MSVISATRERNAREITIVSAEQSRAFQDEEENYAAVNAIDLDLDTRSRTAAASDGKVWLKLKLDKVTCIEQIVWYSSEDNPHLTWTCTSTDCSICAGGTCKQYSLTVSSQELSTDDLPPFSDCKYGDTAMIQMTTDVSYFSVREISITGKQGEFSGIV